MRRAAILLMMLPCACHQHSPQGEAVRQVYENRADAVDRQAGAQPTPVARKIYHARADSLREEGKDREKGLEGREPSSGQGSRSNAGVAGANAQQQ